MLLIYREIKGIKTSSADQASRILVKTSDRNLLTLERSDRSTLLVNKCAVPEYVVVGYDPDAFIEGGVKEITGRVWVDADIPRPRSSPRSWDQLGHLEDILRTLYKPAQHIRGPHH